ncbi:MAG TPA: response regulator [Candidatus Goldiibacteriota bacterium]|nr:response regulator [Candidatus Goldiibacteriota bacterium]HRQ44513.1 response regulator [Candidatus Goldiibacteriota bacterium]
MAYNFLIVDDSITTRTIIKKILQLSSIEIGELHEAADGEEALEVLQNKWIDLVFADINMPRMNGVEMVQRMREDGMLKSIPVVIVSSEGSETRIEEMMAKGIKAYLRKPFTPENIKELAESILNLDKRGE